MDDTKGQGRQENPEEGKLVITAKEADRWDVFGDFGIDPRVIAARKKNPPKP